jgi:arylsulfatase
MKILQRISIASLGLALLASVGSAIPAETPPPKPNILLILADDLGYSDLGCFGGEIHTPNLDALAAHGLRLTQFYNSARCCPSRASLLTGLYPHQAGMGGMAGATPGAIRGYEGHLTERCVTIAEVLGNAGYRTYMVGKWHLGAKPNPIERGFNEFYGMIGGFNSFWQEQPFYTRLPEDRPHRVYAPDKFYSTDVFADYALDFLAQARHTADRPWFLYLAFNAPHFPLHAPKEEIAKYTRVYQQGWDKIRDARYAKMKQLGLLDDRWPLTPRSEYWNPKNNTQGVNPAWDSLDDDRRADLARRMAIFAGMVDRMDQNVGRVVESLRKHGELDNTLVFFLSDNGACAEWDPFGFDERSGPKNILHKDGDLDRMGGPESYLSYGSGWANAGNTPLRLYKHYAHEGGISTPLIVQWPAGMRRKGELDSRPGHITDIMATCTEVAGATYPKSFNDHAILPMEGSSLLPALRNERPKSRTIFFEHEGNRAVRADQWKLVSLNQGPWELYDIGADRTELKNLASVYPELVAKLSGQWDEWAERCFVKRDAADSNVKPSSKEAKNHQKK